MPTTISLDDLLELFEFDLPLRQPGPRGQKVIRVLFGLFLAGLSFLGVAKGLGGGYSDTNWLFNMSAIFVFVALILFGLLTVALGLKSHWAAWLVPISFVLVFLSRILFGP